MSDCDSWKCCGLGARCVGGCAHALVETRRGCGWSSGVRHSCFIASGLGIYGMVVSCGLRRLDGAGRRRVSGSDLPARHVRKVASHMTFRNCAHAQ